MRTPTFVKKYFHDLIWDFPANKKELFLTFDDGPTPGVTDDLLKTLEKYNAKATFFCIARNIERHPEIFRKILKQGHGVGNHTYSHLKGWNVSIKEYLNDIELAAKFIDSDLFRPPYGRITRKQIVQLKEKYKIVLWDVMSRDYNEKLSCKKVQKIVFNQIKPGSIIVFHDSLKSEEKIKTIIPLLLEKFSSLGYTFAAIK